MSQRAANLPSPSLPWMDKDGRPTTAFRNFMIPFAALNVGPFVQAASDAAAAAAGVPIGGVYQHPASGALFGRRI